MFSSQKRLNLILSRTLLNHAFTQNRDGVGNFIVGNPHLRLSTVFLRLIRTRGWTVNPLNH